MEKTRIAIVGLGSVAQAFHLPILSKLSDVEIVAICDLDRAKARSDARLVYLLDACQIDSHGGSI